jgi:iron(III) transport system substrate-binding protein
VMLDAFMKQYPEIKGSVVRTTAQVAYQRLLQDLKNGIAQCDVFSSTDLGHDEALRDQGRFLKYTPPNVPALRQEFQGLDRGGTYYATLSELVVPIFNTNRVKPAEAPRNWTDLLDPKWRGQIAVGHPAFSGTVGTWVVAMRKLYGWDYFTRLEKNKPLIGRSVNDAVGVLTAGERTVGIGPSGLSQVTAARGNPVGISLPTDGAVLIVSPSAIMANAPHPNAAKLFMNFLLGPEMSRISNEVHRLPVRADTSVKVGERDYADIKVLRLSTADIVDGMQDAIEQWRDTFGS